MRPPPSRGHRLDDTRFIFATDASKSSQGHECMDHDQSVVIAGKCMRLPWTFVLGILDRRGVLIKGMDCVLFTHVHRALVMPMLRCALPCLWVGIMPRVTQTMSSMPSSNVQETGLWSHLALHNRLTQQKWTRCLLNI